MPFGIHPIVRHVGKKGITHLFRGHSGTWTNQNLTNGNLGEPEIYYRPLLEARGRLQKELKKKNDNSLIPKF